MHACMHACMHTYIATVHATKSFYVLYIHALQGIKDRDEFVFTEVRAKKNTYFDASGWRISGKY